MKLQGKVALITGTSPNIGGGIAEGLADEGVRVVCVDIQPDNANQCAASIVQRGGQEEWIRGAERGKPGEPRLAP